jgi:hypothetical protein
LVIPVSHWDATILSLLLGLTPYALLAAFAPRITRPSVLWVAGLAVAGIDVVTGIAAMLTTSSTGAVAVLIAPLISAIVVIPSSLALDLALERGRARL